MPPTTPAARTLASFAILFLFLISLLWSGIFENLHTSVGHALGRLSSSTADSTVLDYNGLKGLPDFGQYVHLGTISEEELDLEHRRLIIVGDIHGMKSSLDKMLKALSYTSSDLLVHLGDTISKGPDSLSVLQQFTDVNITGVRGNHEQTIIEWRGWIEWVESQEGGVEWLAKMERSKKNGRRKDLKWPIPKGWKFLNSHYRIARSMTASQYSYLRNLPLVLHLPSLHTHLVHAGILPFDPKFSPTASEQPLAHVPKAWPPPPTSVMRAAQEVALLTEINPNTDPWVLLNMRSVLDDNVISRKWKHHLTPWSDLWDMTMKRCKGYKHHHNTKLQDDVDNSAAFRLPCLPISVIYGHAAGRGLDIKRWSFGLDTGCVYGRNLTAMVITNSNTTINVPDAQTRQVLFGAYGTAQLVSIPCAE